MFLYSFAKSERDNIDDDELATLRDLCKAWLNAGEMDIERALAEGILAELDYEKATRRPSRLAAALLETADDMRRS